VSDVHFVLQPGAILGGRVRTTLGVSLSNIWVDVYDSTPEWIDSALTDTQGQYRLSGLHGGSYYVRTYANGYNYADEWYNDVAVVGWTLPTNAAAVALPAGGINTNVNFNLAVGAMISGTVTSSLGNGVADARIDAFTGSGDYVNSGRSGTNGVYSVANLPAGTFYLRTDVGAVNLVDEWYDNLVVSGSEIPLGASPVSLTSGAVQAGIDFGLVQGGGISGSVTDTNVLPIADVLVDAYDAASNWMTSASTAEDGGYEILGLPPPGPYFLRTFDNARVYAGEWYNNIPVIGSGIPASAAPLAVSTGGVLPGINFALSVGGSVTGRATDSLSTPLEGLDVNAYSAGYELVGDSRTAYDGTYTISALPAGSFYIRTATDSTNLVNEWFNDTPAVGAGIPLGADAVSVSFGAVTGPVDFALASGGVVSGQVRNATLQPIDGVAVNLYDPGSNWVKGAQTSANGTYAVMGLPAGIYYARSLAADLGYADEWYSDLPAPIYGIPAGAAGLSVSAGGTVGPVDFGLARAGGLGGKVTDEAGSALVGIGVDAYQTGGAWLGAASSGSDGSYQVTGLAPGTYYVRTLSGAFGFRDEWYDNRPLIGDAIPPGAAGVSVASDGTTPGVDFALGIDILRAGRDGSLVWMVWQAASGTVYRVERSADLLAWTNAPNGTNAVQQGIQTGVVQDLLLYEDIHISNAVFHYRIGAGP